MVDATALAARLRRARATRSPIDPLTQDEPGLDLTAAYTVQRAQRPTALAGWKLGVTSRAKQAQVQLPAPVYGHLDTADALDPGELLDTSPLIQPRVEPEIVFLLGRDLAGPHVRAADVLAATAGVAVGLEVLDSRFRDYRFTMADVVADRVSASRHLVGAPMPPAGLDLRLVGVVLEKNGALVATAAGAASMGHPASAVAWLVRALAAEGEGLRAGQIVLSGGLTEATPVTAGDVVTATIDRLGSLMLPCR
jgi:2-keto-4-pentenoate hydratase